MCVGSFGSFVPSAVVILFNNFQPADGSVELSLSADFRASGRFPFACRAAV